MTVPADRLDAPRAPIEAVGHPITLAYNEMVVDLLWQVGGIYWGRLGSTGQVEVAAACPGCQEAWLNT